MNGCQRCREAVSAGLDGEDEPRDRLIVDNHLDRCAPCREFATAARELDELTRRRAGDAPPVTGDHLRIDVPVCAPRRPHLRPVGNATCGCSPDCSCGCQHGRACRCHAAA
ncbi:zf-HC2 domain-containing protein [Pseudonocardia endophytica]|uniref:Putative zinc finger protein n=1 Tax=Pseudonocardia endophytica TaxID=401976 RepID=A0A4R1HHN4_PSEEN|nr:zf-HC2 domain-containing protein [Pseudonocardia endophytica]TCK21737.1 putative zinc finger protein [Pseudonocardia endophytica]